MKDKTIGKSILVLLGIIIILVVYLALCVSSARSQALVLEASCGGISVDSIPVPRYQPIEVIWGDLETVIGTTTTGNGFPLEADSNKFVVNLMIDSVLDSVVIYAITVDDVIYLSPPIAVKIVGAGFYSAELPKWELFYHTPSFDTTALDVKITVGWLTPTTYISGAPLDSIHHYEVCVKEAGTGTESNFVLYPTDVIAVQGRSYGEFLASLKLSTDYMVAMTVTAWWYGQAGVESAYSNWYDFKSPDIPQAPGEVAVQEIVIDF